MIVVMVVPVIVMMVLVSMGVQAGRPRRVSVTVAIGSRFGLEAFSGERHAETQFTHHVVEHVVVLVGQAERADLQRDVAIAQVVSGAA